ncbi:MAG: hypothetical protein DFNUSKGM_001613 [Candidatus Fervidibacter sacchari]
MRCLNSSFAAVSLMRCVFAASLLAICLAPFSAQEAAQPSLPLVGAIRWDAWHGELSEVGKAVEKTLSPPKYHFRLPWFAKIHPDGKVTIRGESLEVLEQEIAYARQAGLDYWAFVTYPEDHPLSLPLLHFIKLPTERRKGLRFCNIVEWARFGGPQHFRRWVERLVRYFRDPSYVRVLNERPLLYLLTSEESIKWVLNQWGSVEAFKEVVDSLRREAKLAGLNDPYLVVMHFSPERGDEIRRKIGADALSSYAVAGWTSPEGAPFSKALYAMKWVWNEMAKRAPTVPIVSFGWDPRPRIDNPVPWHKPKLLFYQTFTPDECAQALKEALDFVAANPQACPANTVIIYAWNEFDEGGWLCPTLGADGKPDTSRIEAVGKILQEWKPKAQK